MKDTLSAFGLSAIKRLAGHCQRKQNRLREMRVMARNARELTVTVKVKKTIYGKVILGSIPLFARFKLITKETAQDIINGKMNRLFKIRINRGKYKKLELNREIESA
jgi:hypothetical protein